MLLSELIDRDVAIEWPEAVALVRAVLEQVLGSQFPDLAQVELLPSGQVEAGSARPVNDPVSAAGQMLQTLMSRADPPVQLRLLNAQAHASTGEYYDALGFFERPNRAAVLLGLYARAAAAAAIVRPQAAADLSAFTPEEPPPAAAERSRPVGLASRSVVLAACACAMLVIMGIGSWLASRTAGAEAIGENVEATPVEQVAPDQPSESSPKPKGIGSAIGSVVSAIEQRLGLSGAAAARQDSKPPEIPAATENGSRAAAPGSRTSAAGSRRTNNEPVGSATPARNTTPVPSPAETTASGPLVLSHEAVTLIADTTVYGSESPGVIAAEGRRPQLPSISPEAPGVAGSELRGIELLIRPDGSVESVKLVGAPRDIHDSMLLSAAKAWQFYPAMKAGVPVRYRKTVWIPKEMWGQN